ncbi:MAG: SdiA-regulated domain-containing protein, partial [Bacteroidales bacterium]|nr:SdiA-regulated domain-containing protein [Bacteroidales bacterium]
MTRLSDNRYLANRRPLLPLLVTFITAMLLLSACATETAPTSENNDFTYDLSKPDKVFELPVVLDEISGLAYDDVNDRLIAVQDELGYLFFIDPVNGSLIGRVKFGKPGDYEGLTLVNDTVFVVRSDGRIYSVANYDKASLSTNSYKTPLSTKNDVEGLAY